MRGPFVQFAIGLSIQFAIGAPIAMAASSGPPRVNIEATCGASEKDLISVFGSAIKETTAACVKQENDALEQIKKNWATYPASAKTLCVQPNVYSPSYVEWLTCFEMDVDVRKIRAENAKAQAKAEADAKAQAKAEADAKAQAKAAPQRRQR